MKKSGLFSSSIAAAEERLRFKQSRLGMALKAAGMEQVDDHVNPAWREAALDAIYEAARVLRKLTADDVMARISDNYRTHDLRALGPQMLKAAKMGWIKKAALPGQNSARPNQHAAPLTVWESQVFEEQDA